VVEISRPVTDCSGLSLELGDENIPTLGEVSFYARALAQVEMEEIMGAGYTLNAIAVGKRIFAPETTPFDETRSKNEEAFENAKDERVSASQDLQVDGTLTRQMVYLTENPIDVVRDPPIIVPDSSPCSPVAAYGADTSCHVMSLNETDVIPDTALNSQYFPLIKPEYLPPGKGIKDRAFLGVKKTDELIRYDPVAFPSWCGGSASFSLWVECEGPGGYIIARYQTSAVPWPEKFWKLATSPTGDYIGAWVPHPGVAGKQNLPGVTEPGCVLLYFDQMIRNLHTE